MYSRADFTRHTEAIDAMESILSASHHDLNQQFAGRLDRWLNEYIELLEMFEKPSQIWENKQIGHCFNHLVFGHPTSGLDIKKFNFVFEILRRRIKGKLFNTGQILQAGRMKGKCLNPGEHGAKCMCKGLRKFELAAQEMGDAKG